MPLFRTRLHGYIVLLKDCQPSFDEPPSHLKKTMYVNDTKRVLPSYTPFLV